MTITIPLAKVPASVRWPRLLVLYWLPKIGKTTSLAELPNSLLIDLENGSDYVSAVKVKAENFTQIREILAEVKTMKYPFKFIILDTLSALEEMCLSDAARLYRETVQGKNFPSNWDVRKLANWWWYLWIRKSIMWLVKEMQKYADTIIIVWHVKEKNLSKEDTVVTANDLAVQWNLKSILSSQSDWVGYMFRKWNQNFVTFKQQWDIICWTRCTYLEGREILVSTQMENGVIESNWEWLFPSNCEKVDFKNEENSIDTEKLRPAKEYIVSKISEWSSVEALKSSVTSSNKYNDTELNELFKHIDETYVIFNNPR